MNQELFLNQLQQLGIAKNTLIVFTSDNGCSPSANFKELREKGHDPSAGFRGTKAEPIKGGGIKFKEWTWLELSCVTIPCNQDANILAVKNCDGKEFSDEELALVKSPHAELKEKAAALLKKSATSLTSK